MKHIGFIGLGIMGSRMALNLHKKGYSVTVFNRTKARSKALEKEGLKVASSVAQLSGENECICTCVADPKALREVTFGPDGVLENAKNETLFIDFSTVGPNDTEEIDRAARAKKIDFVEAPVTGSKNGAQNATLLLMVGANAKSYARAQPIFEAVGQKNILCGEVGSAARVKLAGNLLIATMLEALTEGMLLCSKSGVSPQRLIEVVQASGFRSPYFDFKGPTLLSHDFDTHFSVDLMHKDLNLFVAEADGQKVHAPLSRAMADVYALARAKGKGAKDIGAILEALEETCGHRLS